MKYRITHSTWYAYTEPAPVCHNVVHLAPRTSGRQSCQDFRLHIDPAAAYLSRREDYFGNMVEHFSIEGAHRQLCVTADSVVEVAPLALAELADSPPWEEIASTARTLESALDPQVVQLLYPSPRVPTLPELRSYAHPSFTAGRPIVAAVQDLTARIHRDFAFDARATTVSTPLAEAFKLRRGVCQDFAHLAVGSLRAVGIPARYVSGYLRTTPPAGKPRMVGADASHAWASAWCGPLGWVDFDPTNDALVSDSHVMVAWGRDYGDVCPIQGVFVGGGDHRMGVSVDVVPHD